MAKIHTKQKTLRVGAFDMKIVGSPDALLDGSYADFDLARRVIRVGPGLAPAMEHATLWHEALHGVFYGAGVRDHDEEMIELISQGIVQILRDNPWMAQPADKATKEQQSG